MSIQSDIVGHVDEEEIYIFFANDHKFYVEMEEGYRHMTGFNTREEAFEAIPTLKYFDNFVAVDNSPDFNM